MVHLLSTWLMFAACAATGPSESPEGPTETLAPSAPKEMAKVSIPTTLRGTWSASGEVPGPNGEPGLGWDMEVQLQDGKYVRTGYPAWDEHATIVRIEQTERRFTLHLTDHMRNGDAVADGVVTLELSADGATLTLENFILRK